MRKLTVISCLLGLLVFISCERSTPGFTITGTGDLLTEGEMVYLTDFTPKGMVFLDSAEVKRGTFEFKGTPDSILRSHYLAYLIDGKAQSLHVFLEKGAIRIAINHDKTSVTGTPLNNRFQTFMEEFKQRSTELAKLYGQLKSDTAMAEEKRMQLQREIAHKDSLAMEKVWKSVEENAGNAIGVYLLANFGTTFDAVRVQTVLNRLPVAYASDPLILRLKEDVNRRLQIKTGTTYVEIRGKSPEGNEVALSAIVANNKYTLVDFWASWCPDCRKEMPELIEIYAKYKYKGLEIVGVSLDSNAEAWQKSIGEQKLGWLHLSDLKGKESPVIRDYGIQFIPKNILIDQQGVIVAVDLHGNALQEKLGDLMK